MIQLVAKAILTLPEEEVKRTARALIVGFENLAKGKKIKAEVTADFRKSLNAAIRKEKEMFKTLDFSKCEERYLEKNKDFFAKIEKSRKVLYYSSEGNDFVYYDLLEVNGDNAIPVPVFFQIIGVEYDGDEERDKILSMIQEFGITIEKKLDRRIWDEEHERLLKIENLKKGKLFFEKMKEKGQVQYVTCVNCWKDKPWLDKLVCCGETISPSLFIKTAPIDKETLIKEGIYSEPYGLINREKFKSFLENMGFEVSNAAMTFDCDKRKFLEVPYYQEYKKNNK